MKMKFYFCRHCKNVIAYIKNSGVEVVCCGEPMKEIVANTVDSGAEKHVPVIIRNKNKVKIKIGSTEHPMVDQHFIEWVALQTKHGNQRKALLPGQKPEVVFCVDENDEIEAVYEYCNIHGLWKA